MRRPALLLLLALVVAAIAWIAWPRSDHNCDPRGNGAPPHANSDGGVLHAEEDGPKAAGPTLEGRASESGDTRGSDGEFREQDERGYTLRGTLVLSERDGRQLEVPEGKIEIELVGRDGGFSSEIAEVSNGRWSLPIQDVQRVRPLSVKIGSRIAFFPEHLELKLAVEGRIQNFRARFPRPVMLRVVDSDTGADLNDVRLVRHEDGPRGDLSHPGSYDSDRVVANGASSPLAIPAGFSDCYDTDAAFFACSVGYAWRRVNVDLTTGGERTFALRKGGSVRVRLAGESPARHMLLRVRSATGEEDRPVAEYQLGAVNELLIEGLSPGAYRVTVEIGEWFVHPKVLAETPCKVVAGKRVQVVLAVPKLEAPDAVPLAGEVHLPEAWGLTQFRLSLYMDRVPLVRAQPSLHLSTGDALKSVPGRSGVWMFDAGLVQPGLYMFIVGGTGYRTAIRVGSHGNRTVRVVAPPPVRVSVRVVDASTGTDTTAERVWWQCKTPEGISGWWAAQDVMRDPETRRFEFRAPIGEIWLAAGSDDYTEDSRQLQVVPGLPQQTLTIEPLASVLIVLRDGGVKVPGWPVWDVKVTPLGGDGRVVEVAEPHRGAILQLDKPGRYRLELPRIPDYEAVPPQEVVVRTGKLTRLELDLTRSVR